MPRWMGKVLERIAVFLMGSTFALLLACVLVSVMLNLSIIAQKLARGGSFDGLNICAGAYAPHARISYRASGDAITAPFSAIV